MAVRTVGVAGGNYNVAGTWVEGVVPTNLDDVVFTVLSGPLTITAAAAAKTIDFTNYINTITINAGNTLGISGNVTLVTGFTWAGAGIFAVNATSTIISNGATLAAAQLSLATTGVITFADAAIVSGIFFVSSLSFTLNCTTISITGSYNGNSATFTGTGTITMSGTGTIAHVGGQCGVNFVINTAGSYTIGSFRVGGTGVTFTYIAGTIAVTAGTTFGCINGLTCNSSTIPWINVSINGALTLTSTLNCSTTLTISTCTITGTGYLTSCTTLTVTANGTYVLANNLTVSGNFNMNANAVFTAAISVFIGGSLLIDATHTLTSTAAQTLFVFNTASSANITSSGGILSANVEINKPSGTLTFGSMTFGTATILYTAGTTVTAGTTITTTGSCAFNTSGNAAGTGTTTSTSGINFNNITMSSTITNTSAMCVVGTITCNSGGSAGVLNGSNVYFQGSFSVPSFALPTGTSLVTLNGTGTFNGTGGVGNSIVINTSGTITFAASIVFAPSGGKTFTYTAGTVITTGNTFSCNATNTLNTAGIIFNNFSTAIQGTITNNSLLTVSGTLTYASSAVGVTWGGTHGWTAGTFICTFAGVTHTFTTTHTYTITGAFTVTAATNTSRIFFRSNSSGVRAPIILNTSATQNVSYVNATDIDSSAGQTINSYKGVISNTLNWYVTNGDFLALAYP